MASGRKNAGNKTKALRIHAKRQAQRRYNVVLNTEDLAHLVNLIRDGQALFVARKSLRVSCWKVSFEGREMVVLYDKQRKAIVTFLPANCWEVRSAESLSRVSTSPVHRPFETSSIDRHMAFSEGLLPGNPAT